MRDTILISHANPEDNRFTRWLALRLARDGYLVWSDLTGFLGGESIWRGIEHLIRDRAAKILCALSRASNQRDGVLKELQVGSTVAAREHLTDFIIPLRVDDVPHSDMNIYLNGLFATPFDVSWTLGYSMLAEKLRRDGVQKNPDCSPGTVSGWWTAHINPPDAVVAAPENHVSNWFPFELPRVIHLFEIRPGLVDDVKFRYPASWLAPYLVSFAPATDVGPDLQPHFAIRQARSCSTATFLNGDIGGFSRRQARDVVYRLLRIAWDRFMAARGLRVYEIANRALCGYFTQTLVGEERIGFKTSSGHIGSRQLVGYKTRSRKQADGTYAPVRHYWHFAIEARPLVYPKFAYVIVPHVLFSHDGVEIWSSKKALQRARRSVCSEWWNDHWRDRLLAAMSWLAREASSIEVPLGADLSLMVECDPISFHSPVSYQEPAESDLIDDRDDSDDEVDDE